MLAKVRDAFPRLELVHAGVELPPRGRGRAQRVVTRLRNFLEKNNIRPTQLFNDTDGSCTAELDLFISGVQVSPGFDLMGGLRGLNPPSSGLDPPRSGLNPPRFICFCNEFVH